MERRDFIKAMSAGAAGLAGVLVQNVRPAAAGCADAPGQGIMPPPPGVVIDASPDSASIYLGSPSMEILPDGSYVASHEWFGDGARNLDGQTDVFRSVDRGATWERISEIPNARAHMMFWAGGALWMIGWIYPEGGIARQSIVIRRSDDGGRTWTVPKDGGSGLLLADSETNYFCDPAPVLVHGGRIWKEVEIEREREPGRINWSRCIEPILMSAPVDSDLLDRASWTFTNSVKWLRRLGEVKVQGPRQDWNCCWEDSVDWEKLGGWVEGNALFDPAGKMMVLMRVDDMPSCGKAARLEVSDDFKTLSFDPHKGLFSMPGGCKKFVIKYDPVSGKYWSLVSWVHPDDADAPDKERTRNTLALVASEDLVSWEVRTIVYRHPDRQRGFQYVDWRIVGDDIHFVCRLAWYGSPNCHDANFLTFDRLENFRTLTRADDAPAFVPPR